MGFEYFNKGLVGRIVNRRRGMGGGRGARWTQEIIAVKRPLNFAEDVLGDAAQIVVPEAIECGEKPSLIRPL